MMSSCASRAAWVAPDTGGVDHHFPRRCACGQIRDVFGAHGSHFDEHTGGAGEQPFISEVNVFGGRIVGKHRYDDGASVRQCARRVGDLCASAFCQRIGTIPAAVPHHQIVTGRAKVRGHLPPHAP
jgi:hypothetical protein